MAETKVDLNTGFTSGPAGLHKVSRLALETMTPSAMPSEGKEGALKRKVLEPDQFPRVSLEITNPHDPEDADVDQAAVGKGRSIPDRQGKVRSNKTNDGKSLTA